MTDTETEDQGQDAQPDVLSGELAEPIKAAHAEVSKKRSAWEKAGGPEVARPASRRPAGESRSDSISAMREELAVMQSEI